MTNSETDAIRVLVVDDDQAILQLLQVLFRRQGWATDTAADGMQALEKLANGEPDVVVLDLMMPRSSGFDVLAQMKESQPDLLQHVIVATAAANPVLRGLEGTSIWKLLRKPFDISELVQEIRACHAAHAMAAVN